VKRAAEAGFEVPQQRVDPTELRQVVGVLPTGDDGLMAAACRGHRAEAGQAIGEHCAPRSQVLPGPGADCLRTEPSHRCDFGVNRVACLAEGNGCNDGNLVFRSSTCLAARSFSAEVGIIHLDLSPQHVGILPLAHGPENLVMQQPGGVVLHAQMAAELERGDARFGLPDQIESLKPSGERQFGGLHDRAGRECGLMAAGTALITLEPAAIDQSMLMTSAARTTKPIGPAGFLQGGLTLLLGAVKPLELRQGEAFLELDRAASHGLAGICVPVYGSGPPCAEQAG